MFDILANNLILVPGEAAGFRYLSVNTKRNRKVTCSRKQYDLTTSKDPLLKQF